MRFSKWFGMGLAVLLVGGFAWAEDNAGELVRFKSGPLSLTLLESDGVTPMSDATIQMQNPEDAAVMAESVSDKQGNADLTMAAGRYLLNVSGRTLSVLEVADDATLTACRVVVPEAAMLVAGEDEEEEEEDRKGAYIWLKPVVIGGVVVLVAAGGYAIYDNNRDDDDDKKDEQPIPPAPVPAPKSKPTPGRTPPPPRLSAYFRLFLRGVASPPMRSGRLGIILQALLLW